MIRCKSARGQVADKPISQRCLRQTPLHHSSYHTAKTILLLITAFRPSIIKTIPAHQRHKKASFDGRCFFFLQTPTQYADFTGRDLLGCLRSGSGKTLIYQAASFLAGELIPVYFLRPLISLKNDISRRCSEVHQPCIAVDGQVETNTQYSTLPCRFDEAAQGKGIVLLLTPEKSIRSRSSRQCLSWLRAGGVGAGVFHQVHTVTEWGRHFRKCGVGGAAKMLRPQVLMTSLAGPACRSLRKLKSFS